MTDEELEERLRQRTMPALSPELRTQVLATRSSTSFISFALGLAAALFMGLNLSLLIARLPNIALLPVPTAITSFESFMEHP